MSKEPTKRTSGKIEPLKVIGVNELLKKEFPPPSKEEMYRRAYCDGWIQAVDAFYELMMEGKQSREKAYDILWDHWEEVLCDWARAASNNPSCPIVFPPSVSRIKK